MLSSVVQTVLPCVLHDPVRDAENRRVSDKMQSKIIMEERIKHGAYCKCGCGARVSANKWYTKACWEREKARQEAEAAPK